MPFSALPRPAFTLRLETAKLMRVLLHPISFHIDCGHNQKNCTNCYYLWREPSQRAFRCVAPPGIHHLQLAVNRQPHCPSYYTPISFHTDCEHKQKNLYKLKTASLWHEPRLGDAPFGASPRPAFTICGFQLELDTL